MKRAFITAILALMLTAPAQAFTIWNNGSHTVENIYQSDPDSSRWGQDRLSGYLHPTYHWDSPLHDLCSYDIKIVWSDGTLDTWYGFDTCAKDLYLSY